MTDSAAQRGVVVPLALLFAAFTILLFAGFYQGLGPLDESAAAWVARGVWIAAPVVAGVLCRDVEPRETRRAALALGIIVALVAIAFIYMSPRTAVQRPDCPGIPRTAVSSALGAIAVAGVLGFGVAAAEFVTARIARRAAAVVGVALGTAVSSAANAAGYYLLYSVVVVCL
jgi:hypothetical protein